MIYVLGKYFGVVFSLITVEFLIVLLISSFIVIIFQWPILFVIYNLLAVVILSAPGLCFITAFSLACPLIMPVRVYQILFTGYWYRGNYLSPKVMSTVSDTAAECFREICPDGLLWGANICRFTPDCPRNSCYKHLCAAGLCWVCPGCYDILHRAE